MLEFPESHVLAEQLHSALAGRRIAGVKLLQTPHRFAFFSEERDE